MSGERHIDIAATSPILELGLFVQPYSFRLIDGIRLLLFLAEIFILFLSARQSSMTIREARRLPLVYNVAADSIEMIERENALKKLSKKWSIYTVIDFTLVAMLIYEFINGIPAADLGLEYYTMIHLVSAVLVSFVIGLLVSGLLIRFRNPFKIGIVDPMSLLLGTLDSLIAAAKPDEGGGHGYVNSILQRVVSKEIEMFMSNRDLGESERGRLLEYLSHKEGVIGEVASSLLWPI